LLSNTASFSWGPYAYRTNGAQYFNLVWPVSLGFWWVLRGESARKRNPASRIGGDASMVLLPGTILMAVCPLVATSRGGTLILLVLLAASLVVLALAPKASGKIGRIVAAGVFLLVLGLGWFLGGEALKTRFSTVFEDKLSNRTEVWEAADRMAEDAGWLGTGAETFTGLYSLYRTNPDDTWNAFAHNDWIETRITLGWLGFGAVIAMLLLLPVIWFSGRGLRPPREFTLLLLLSLIGVLVHARFDFPFQMFSLTFLFLLLSALGMSTAGRESVGGGR
jgi:O-antigen ligase